MRVAFYAPLKPPDHAVPSGDRLMANLLMRAMQLAGHEVEIVSRFRSFTRRATDHALFAEAEAEQHRISVGWAARTQDRLPDLWFTYHPYYKAPDLIGPELARARGIPYVTAEASYAGKRDLDDWAKLQARVKSAISEAQINFCLTPVDREGLSRFVAPERLCDLPPFIDATGLQAAETDNGGKVRLVSVAMMRPGVKVESYRLLAQVLGMLCEANWTLTVIGDGSERQMVQSMFSGHFADRVTFTGELDRTGLAQQLACHDIFVWPGIGEAYGLAYLEAQACGLPVAAVDNRGVPSVVVDGTTGLLSSLGDAAGLANNLDRLIGDGPLRARLGSAARAFVHDERSIDVAAGILDQGLKRAVDMIGKTELLA